MDMHDRAKAEHAAGDPAKHLAGDLLDTAIVTASVACHSREGILNGAAGRCDIIRRSSLVTDSGLRHRWHGAQRTAAVHHQTCRHHTVPQHPAAGPHHVGLDFDNLSLFMGQGAGFHIVDDFGLLNTALACQPDHRAVVGKKRLADLTGLRQFGMGNKVACGAVDRNRDPRLHQTIHFHHFVT